MMDEKDLEEYHNIGKNVKGMKKANKYNYLQGKQITDEESGNRVSKEQRRYLKNERERILASDAYHKFEASSVGDITIREAQSIFRINDYIQGESRIEKVATLVSAFGEDKVLGALVNYCASLIEVKEQS